MFMFEGAAAAEVDESTARFISDTQGAKFFVFSSISDTIDCCLLRAKAICSLTSALSF